MVNVAVLLSTYNGERFLKELLDSVFFQEGINSLFEITMYVRDDGSKDQTLSILRNYKKGRIVLFEGENQGACRSFLSLVERVPDSFDYYFFCDQDDVWKREKINSAIQKISSLGLQRPVLYYCGLDVVDEGLNKISDYYRDPTLANDTFTVLCEGSLIPGCCMAFNLLMFRCLVSNIPSSFGMHDALVHIECLLHDGVVCGDKQSYLLYRQHSNNVIGMKKKTLFKRISQMLKRKHVYSDCYKQLLIKNHDISVDNRHFLELFAFYDKDKKKKKELMRLIDQKMKGKRRGKAKMKILFSRF